MKTPAPQLALPGVWMPDDEYERDENDTYETPNWCVHRLLERVYLPRGRWLEPAAGWGRIIESCKERGVVPPNWDAFEVRDECRAELLSWVATGSVHMQDFLKWESDTHEERSRRRDPPFVQQWTYDLAIMNPPFRLAVEFVQACLRVAPIVVCYLRLGFLASATRHPFLSTCMPERICVLPDRPRHRPQGTSDNADYGWFIWSPDRHRTEARIELLDTTPLAHRRRYEAELRCA